VVDGVHLTVVIRAMAVSASPMQVADERGLLTGECYFDIARKRTEGLSCML
jgi:hypothetical protein